MDSKEFVRYCNLMQYMKYSTICNNVANMALSFVGQGDYGTAYLLSDGRVGKIYKTWDAAYISFLNLVGVSHSPHLPRIFEKGRHKQFSFVVLEFLTPYEFEKFPQLSFTDMCCGLTAIICGKENQLVLPSSLIDLGQELKESAPGFCLDFREENFRMRKNQLVTIDPFTLKTKNNSHLQYVSAPEKA